MGKGTICCRHCQGSKSLKISGVGLKQLDLKRSTVYLLSIFCLSRKNFYFLCGYSSLLIPICQLCCFSLSLESILLVYGMDFQSYINLYLVVNLT